MSLNLDPRQRAMLLEMGVRVWQPKNACSPRNLNPSTGTVLADARLPDSSVVPALKNMNEIRLMDWPAIRGSISVCQACAMGQGRTQSIAADEALLGSAQLMVVGDLPDENEERYGEPFAGPAGVLLDNMLSSMGLNRKSREDPSKFVYTSLAIKCRPGLICVPAENDVKTCSNYLNREIELVQPKVIVTMGSIAAQSLLSQSYPDTVGKPVGKLRGQVYKCGSVPVVVTYPLEYLLRTPLAKARAWEDLCLAWSVIT